MKKTALVILLLFSGSNLFSQWAIIRTNPSEELYACHFINADTGWIAGSIPFTGSIVLKTTDSGITWEYVYDTPDGDRIESIFFADAENGWAGTYNGRILRTTNGGESWQSISVLNPNSNSRILKMHFINSLTGWIGTEQGYLRTNHGGTSWSYIPLNIPPYYGFDMYFFPNSLTGFVCSAQNIYKTTDGGASYINSYFHNSGEAINSINFINSDTGWALGTHRLVIKTTNGGVDWNTISMDSVQHKCHDFYLGSGFANGNVGYAVGYTFCGGIWGTNTYGLFRKTTDGGLSWNFVNTGSSSYVQDFQFADDRVAFAVGYHGAVYKNINAGLVGAENYNETIPEYFNLFQNYPNPFNPVTKINYSVPVSNTNVKLVIFNLLGKEIMTLVNEMQSAGSYSVNFNGNVLPSGIYFYKITAGEFSDVKKMTLLK